MRAIPYRFFWSSIARAADSYKAPESASTAS